MNNTLYAHDIFDQKLNFTSNEMNSNNEIIYLDTKILFKNNKLQFIKYRKEGIMTVISNYHNSVMSKKYLKGGVLTAFHREYNSCSSHKFFLESLNELKIVFQRNSYPKNELNQN